MAVGTLIIRADASVAIGTGHVMRCLALAQAWQDEGGHCIFAMAEATHATERRVRAEKFDVFYVTASPGTRQDAAQIAALAGTHHASWVVVDGYQFDLEYQRNLKTAGLRVLFLDDTGQCESYCADVVLNQSIHASERTYGNRESYTQLLLGPQYVTLRREFEKWREWKRQIPAVGRRLLVTIGGSDPDKLTFRLIEALSKNCLPSMATTVVIGGSNPCKTELQRAWDVSGVPVDLLFDPPNMPELMSRSDLAIICAGGTLWELLYMGCAVLSYARTGIQEQIIRNLAAVGAVHKLSAADKFDVSQLNTAIAELVASRERRAEMAQIGGKIVDGLGTRRVLKQLRSGDLE